MTLIGVFMHDERGLVDRELLRVHEDGEREGSVARHFPRGRLPLYRPLLHLLRALDGVICAFRTSSRQRRRAPRARQDLRMRRACEPGM